MYHVQHVILGMPGHWSKRCVTPYRNSETLNLGRAFVKALYHTKAKLQIDELKAVLRQCLSPAACRLSLISSVSVTANALARLTPAAGPTTTPPCRHASCLARRLHRSMFFSFGRKFFCVKVTGKFCSEKIFLMRDR